MPLEDPDVEELLRWAGGVGVEGARETGEEAEVGVGGELRGGVVVGRVRRGKGWVFQRGLLVRGLPAGRRGGRDGCGGGAGEGGGDDGSERAK